VIDIKIAEDGDFELDPSTSDLLLTGSNPLTSDDKARVISQLAFFAIKTEAGDFTIHPEIGSSIRQIWGMPNKPSTAKRGENHIRAALTSVGIDNRMDITSWPEDLNTIGYEVKIYIGDNPPKIMKMTLIQALSEPRG
jgi:hypothetical protein